MGQNGSELLHGTKIVLVFRTFRARHKCIKTQSFALGYYTQPFWGCNLSQTFEEETTIFPLLDRKNWPWTSWEGSD